MSKERLSQLMREAADILRAATDDQVHDLLGDGLLDELVTAIATPKAPGESTPYEYLLRNKNRLTMVALLRYAITHNYSIKGVVNGVDCFVAPAHYQWFDDGVIFIQGQNRFEGMIGLYQSGRVKFGLAARDIRPGDSLGPDDLLFIDVDEAAQRVAEKSVPDDMGILDRAIFELDSLLAAGEASESHYQSFLRTYPWVLGAMYESVQSHQSFDDRNIPDFTAVRVRDRARDILEIKSPFLPLFRDDGSFRAEFNEAWNQAERYLDFARMEVDYLYRQKGLRFENPECYLLLGMDLDENQRDALRRKQRMNPAIRVLTYKDLLAVGRSTVNFVKNLKDASRVAEQEPSTGRAENARQ